ncbi:DUF881 domain-containing protein [Streptomyces sp. TR06-5]|uniref:DUF881 domain-containing protein n=1 Tax=unclassified Streptomyces TaxID=2593676 RepID=UPI0039A195E6
MSDENHDDPARPPKVTGRELPPEQPAAEPPAAEPASEPTSPREVASGGGRDDSSSAPEAGKPHTAPPGGGRPRRADSTEGADSPAPASGDGASGESSAPQGPTAEPEPSAGGSGPAVPTGRRRLAIALWPPRITRAQLIAAVLLFVLGLGLAIQVRSTSESSPLRGARQEDLVRILDELDDRTARLQEEKQRLETQRRELESSSDQAEEARRQTRQKKQQLGILAGTVAAQGPGLRLTVSDPSGAVDADMLLDTIQELRAAGAEAIQVNDVRVVAGTYFTGGPGDVRIDGEKVRAPYTFLVIGEPQDLEPALNIPGGVIQTLEKDQAGVDVVREKKIVVDALRRAETPDYARSSQQGGR